jgi:hypothetical protein
MKLGRILEVDEIDMIIEAKKKGVPVELVRAEYRITQILIDDPNFGVGFSFDKDYENYMRFLASYDIELRRRDEEKHRKVFAEFCSMWRQGAIANGFCR